MKIAIIYSSETGNTLEIAQRIKACCEEVVYFGEPKEDIEADLFFVGSWTDKGMCSEKICNFIKTIQNKTIAYFGTAGFGGSKAYYEGIFNRVKALNENNRWLESFFCQGKMPQPVRERYEKMLESDPNNQRLLTSLANFDQALSHPNENDFQQVLLWVKTILEKGEK